MPTSVTIECLILVSSWSRDTFRCERVGKDRQGTQNKFISSRKTVERKPNDPIHLSPTMGPQGFPQSASRIGVVSRDVNSGNKSWLSGIFVLSEKFVHLLLSLLWLWGNSDPVRRVLIIRLCLEKYRCRWSSSGPCVSKRCGTSVTSAFTKEQ